MSKLPKTIKIGHKSYSLNRPKGVLYSAKGEEAWGLNRAAEQAIDVSSKLPCKSLEAEVVLHECLHGLFDHFELQQLESMTDTREEFLVSTLSRGLVMVFHDNPKLMSYLVEAVKENKVNG